MIGSSSIKTRFIFVRTLQSILSLSTCHVTFSSNLALRFSPRFPLHLPFHRCSALLSVPEPHDQRRQHNRQNDNRDGNANRRLSTRAQTGRRWRRKRRLRDRHCGRAGRSRKEGSPRDSSQGCRDGDVDDRRGRCIGQVDRHRAIFAADAPVWDVEVVDQPGGYGG